MADHYVYAFEMAEILGIIARAVEKQLASLKEKDIITRVGPDKGGYWKISVKPRLFCTLYPRSC